MRNVKKTEIVGLRTLSITLGYEIFILCNVAQTTNKFQYMEKFEIINLIFFI